MKKVIFVLISISSIVSMALDNSATTALSREEKVARRKAASEKRIAMNGGWVEKAPEGKTIRIVNAQSQIKPNAIENAAESIKRNLMFSVEIVRGERGNQYRPTDSSPVVLTLSEGGEDATLLIAPEQLWGIINVGALAKDKPSQEVLSNRTQKEIWRALAMLMGASNSMAQPCLMRQINSLEDLDGVQLLSPSPEPFNFMITTAKKLGIGRSYRTSYKRACEEGWAPQPTNDVQRTIWNQVHQIPDKPITIEFDPKKDK